MPATALDAKTALVVIDLQKGIAAMVPAPDVSPRVVANAAKLAEAFRRAKQPVVLVNVAFSADGGDRPRGRTDLPIRALPAMPDFPELLPELARAAERPAHHEAPAERVLRDRASICSSASAAVTGIVLCGRLHVVGRRRHRARRVRARLQPHVRIGRDAPISIRRCTSSS